MGLKHICWMEQLTYGMEGQADQLICGLRKHMMALQYKACNERCNPTRDKRMLNDAAVDVWMASGQLLPIGGMEHLWANPSCYIHSHVRHLLQHQPATMLMSTFAILGPSGSMQENACKEFHLGNVLDGLHRPTANVPDVKGAHGLGACKGLYAVLRINI